MNIIDTIQKARPGQRFRATIWDEEHYWFMSEAGLVCNSEGNPVKIYRGHFKQCFEFIEPERIEVGDKAQQIDCECCEVRGINEEKGLYLLWDGHECDCVQKRDNLTLIRKGPKKEVWDNVTFTLHGNESGSPCYPRLECHLQGKVPNAEIYRMTLEEMP